MDEMKALQTVEPQAGAVQIAGSPYTNPAMAYLAGLAKSGRDTMQGTLNKVARMLGYADLYSAPWSALRFEHVTAIRTKLQDDGAAPATINKTLSALRGVLLCAWKLDLIDAETYQRARAVRNATGSTLPAGRSATPGELDALMRACASDKTATGHRDCAIIALAYATGLRRSALASLTLADIQGDDGETITLRSTGKRSKELLVYLEGGAAQYLRAWLKVRGTEPGALFYAGRRGGHLGHSGMTPQSIMVVLDKRAKQAGIEHLSPHDLRRTFVSDMLDAGVDIATVAAMAGHASVQTTARYDRRGETAKKRAARSLHVPYYGGK